MSAETCVIFHRVTVRQLKLTLPSTAAPVVCSLRLFILSETGSRTFAGCRLPSCTREPLVGLFNECLASCPQISCPQTWHSSALPPPPPPSLILTPWVRLRMKRPCGKLSNVSLPVICYSHFRGKLTCDNFVLLSESRVHFTLHITCALHITYHMCSSYHITYHMCSSYWSYRRHFSHEHYHIMMWKERERDRERERHYDMKSGRGVNHFTPFKYGQIYSLSCIMLTHDTMSLSCIMYHE